MEQISRKEAKTLGLKQYYTGRLCPIGHDAPKWVSNKRCINCAQEKNRKYYAVNKAKRLVAVYNWKRKNRLRTNEINRQSYRRVGRTKAIYYKQWRVKNPDLYRAIVRRRRAAKAGTKGRHTATDIKILFKQQKGACLCGVRLGNKYHVDHKTPLSRGGSNWPRNLQLLCQPCNDSKGVKTMKEWEPNHAR